MKSGLYVAGLMASATLLLGACGGDDSEAGDAAGMNAYAEESSTERAELPADFPRELIPDLYTSSHYTDMKHINGTELVAFESSEPVELSIQHYTELLGEPTINVNGDDGERNVMWYSTPWPPWVVGVIGNDSETIVSVSKVPEQ